MSVRETKAAARDDLDHFDVVILGGGIAGLTLALQLKRTRPELGIAVFERQEHPVPEAAHKVGESSVEMQAHYLRDVLGIEDHLDSQQLRKFGLRMFFPHADNLDIARRVEFGQVGESPLPAYQIDRGRFENALGALITSLGVRFEAGVKVDEVELGGGTDHFVSVVDIASEERTSVVARWLVDATGRAGLLKRKLGLAKPLEHHANASWFRVGHRIDVEDWSDDEQWLGRVPGGKRWRSTNHLMGPGYWVWLIPLASGSTSVGIVADDMHPFAGFNTLERALSWLEDHEPLCAAELRRHRDKIQDFRVMKDYAYDCRQVYSADRWCLTGEAGISIDPLYSSGGDLMGISNGFITDLIDRDARGEDTAELAVIYNQLYLALGQHWLTTYQHQYAVMGNPLVMVAKVIWDTAFYWAIPGLLFFHDKIRRLNDSPQAFADMYSAWSVHARVQEFLREWHSVENVPASDAFADPYSQLLLDLHNGMAAGLPDDELEKQLASNRLLMEQLAGQLVSTVIDRLRSTEGNPAVSGQIERWTGEPRLRELMGAYRERDPVNPIDQSGVTLGSSQFQQLEVLT